LNEGFRAYTSFCKQVMSFATSDDRPCGSNIIPFDEDEVQPGTDEDDDRQINMLL
jgi:hypothetical protein